MNKVIAISGAKGNLGSHLIMALEGKNHQIIPVTRENWDTWHQGISSVDIAVHTAGSIFPESFPSVEDYIDHNHQLTRSFLKKSLEKNVAKFIYFSSSSVYEGGSPIQITTTPNPKTWNGKSKLHDESYLTSQLKKESTTLQVLRVFNMYGGSDRSSIIFKIHECLKKSQQFPLINEGVNLRDFIHVADIAKITASLIDIHDNRKLINLGTGHPIKISSLIDNLKKYDLELDFTSKKNSNLKDYVIAKEDLIEEIKNYHFIKAEEYLYSSYQVE